MAIVSFKKGLVANLPSTHSEGTLYVTTDERAIYLDVSNSARVRLNGVNSSSDSEDGTFLAKTPIGTIVIWSGMPDTIPDGWHLCDGDAGTPDLRDRFILGAGRIYAPKDSGGNEEITLVAEQLAPHSHAIQKQPDLPEGGVMVCTSQQGNQSFEAIANDSAIQLSQGEASPINIMPPYYALCYIMKIKADKTDDSVQEQNNTVDGCDWHIRKWDNGYCELFARKEYILSVSKPLGALYCCEEKIGGFDFPVALTEKYGEQNSLSANSTSLLMPSGCDTIEHSAQCTVGMPEASSDVLCILNVYITGRWK